ncbi:MAG: glycosyltransferase [Chitinophagales bacterium]|nr:glycosyltransferase [Chitinophagales bacterium]
MKKENKSPFLISVCVITYNHAKYVRAALESIFNQQTTYSFEVIIADDCSKDGTIEILKEYQFRYGDQCRLLLQEANKGAANNFLDLLREASGKYIAYLEGDDFWTDSHKLQKQVDFLIQHHEYTGCFHNTAIVDEEGQFVRLFLKEPIETEINQRDLVTAKTSSIGHTNSFVFLSECVCSPPAYFTAAPYDRLLAFLIAEKGKWGGMPDVMSAYRINQGGVYNSIGEIKQVKTMVAIFNAIAADEKNHSRYAIELKERLSFYHHRLMQLYKAEKNKTEYIKHLMRYVSLKEKNLSLFKILIKEELFA